MNPERKPSPGALIYNPAGFTADSAPWFLVIGHTKDRLLIAHLGLGEDGWQTGIHNITSISPAYVWPYGHLRYKEDWPSGMY